MLLKKFVKDFIKAGLLKCGFGIVLSKKEKGNCIFLLKSRFALLTFKEK